MNAWIETDIDDPAFAGAQSRQKRVRTLKVARISYQLQSPLPRGR